MVLVKVRFYTLAFLISTVWWLFALTLSNVELFLSLENNVETFLDKLTVFLFDNKDKIIATWLVVWVIQLVDVLVCFIFFHKQSQYNVKRAGRLIGVSLIVLIVLGVVGQLLIVPNDINMLAVIVCIVFICLIGIIKSISMASDEKILTEYKMP